MGEPEVDILKNPVIYWYPEKSIYNLIKLNLKKINFNTIYPKFNGGKNIWNLHDKLNEDIIILNDTYPYLFWKAESYDKQDLNKGFILKVKMLKFSLKKNEKILV